MQQIDWNVVINTGLLLILAIGLLAYIAWMYMLDRWEKDKYDPSKPPKKGREPNG